MSGFDAPTVWSEFTPLSNEHKSCNLGKSNIGFQHDQIYHFNIIIFITTQVRVFLIGQLQTLPKRLLLR